MRWLAEMLAFVAEFYDRNEPAELLVMARDHAAQQVALNFLAGLPHGSRYRDTASVGPVRIVVRRATERNLWVGRRFHAALVGWVGPQGLREIEVRTGTPVRFFGGAS